MTTEASVSCPACGVESPEGFRFCPACGSALGEVSPSREARKVVTALTLRLVRDAVVVEELVPLGLKGKSDHVAAYRLISVDPEAPGVARHLAAPFVGREDELRVLLDAWGRVVRDSGCHLFTLRSLELSERLAGPDDVINAAMTRRVHSQLAVAEGDLVEAERWARSGVEKAFESDFAFERASSKPQLARVLAASHRREDATAAAREALVIYESKGDESGMGRARALLGRL